MGVLYGNKQRRGNDSRFTGAAGGIAIESARTIIINNNSRAHLFAMRANFYSNEEAKLARRDGSCCTGNHQVALADFKATFQPLQFRSARPLASKQSVILLNNYNKLNFRSPSHLNRPERRKEE